MFLRWHDNVDFVDFLKQSSKLLFLNWRPTELVESLWHQEQSYSFWKICSKALFFILFISDIIRIRWFCMFLIVSLKPTWLVWVFVIISTSVFGASIHSYECVGVTGALFCLFVCFDLFCCGLAPVCDTASVKCSYQMRRWDGLTCNGVPTKNKSRVLCQPIVLARLFANLFPRQKPCS